MSMTRTPAKILADYLKQDTPPAAVIFSDYDEIMTVEVASARLMFEHTVREFPGTEVSLYEFKPKYGSYLRTKWQA